MKTRLWTGIFIAIAIILIGRFAIGEYDGSDRHESYRGDLRSGVTPVRSDLYNIECGACHFAYQPGLLPARSWEKLMSGLEDHFGENAELSQEDHAAIKQYLVDNSAESSNSRHSVRIMRSLKKNEAVERITLVPYIIHQHDELSPRHITENPEVRSLSNCNACHTKADAGSFREDEITIPGFGRWDD